MQDWMWLLFLMRERFPGILLLISDCVSVPLSDLYLLFKIFSPHLSSWNKHCFTDTYDPI